jgi:hypothetical protein
MGPHSCYFNMAISMLVVTTCCYCNIAIPLLLDCWYVIVVDLPLASIEYHYVPWYTCTYHGTMVPYGTITMAIVVYLLVLVWHVVRISRISSLLVLAMAIPVVVLLSIESLLQYYSESTKVCIEFKSFLR